MRLAIALFSIPLMVLVAGPATHGPATQSRLDWSNGAGVLSFALVAPLIDRRLLPAVTRLGVARLDRSAVAESAA